MQRFYTLLGLGVALLVSNATLLLAQPFWDSPRFLAALALVFVLPGWAWLPPLGWLQTNRGLERLVLIFGASTILSAMALLGTVFVPGPFSERPTLIALNLVTLAGLTYQAILIYQSKTQNPGEASKIEWPSRTVLLILLAIVAVAAFTRLTRIGYAEFHEDELENMRLIIRAYKGEEYAPFLDSKGPIHWLLPAALWYANGWVNEGIARTPFALAALMLVPLMYALGRRLGGERDSVGLAAAGFVALNGFFVALARHVETRSLLIFGGALVVWGSYRYYKEGLNSLLLYTAAILAVGLIAHPLMLLYIPVLLYAVLMRAWQQRSAWRQQWLWLVGASLILLGVTATFYVPYFLDPNIDRVFEYFAGERIGEALLYNRVDNMLGEDELYSSRYHAPILILLLAWLLARHFARLGRLGWVIFIGGSLLVLSTVLQPQLWIWGNLNVAFAPYALLTLVFIWLPKTSVELKLGMIWFAVPFGGLLFLAQDASNHIQMAYTGWAVLAAIALVEGWALVSHPSERWPRFHSSHLSSILKAGLVTGGIVLVGLIVFYEYLSFDAQVTTYWRAKVDSATNPASIYNLVYRTIPHPRKIIANPRLGGWKAVGYLWETGVLNGDFRSINESFAGPIWYTFQTPRSCYDDPQNSWVRRDWQGWPEEEQTLLEQGYGLTRIVLVDQEPKLHLYEKGAPGQTPEIIDMEAYRRQFDRLATPTRFARETTGQQPTAYNFGGDRLRLLGYDFPNQPIAPGELVPVTVYWETLAPMTIRYRAFMHLVDDDGKQWGQHDDDPACRLLTTDMRPGQRSSRQFRIPVAPDIPAGEYTVVFGLYDPDTLQRLEIWDATAAQNIGDELVLGKLTVP